MKVDKIIWGLLFILVFPLQAREISIHYNFHAYQQGKDIIVEWVLENEENIKGYVLEKQVEENEYQYFKTVEAAKKRVVYTVLDEEAKEDWISYRLKVIPENGTVFILGHAAANK